MNKNPSYETTVRENLESYDDEELIKKIISGDLTEVSEKIAKSIIEERSKEKNADYLQTLENKIKKVIIEEEKDKNNSIKDKQEYAYQTLKIMNAIGVILWGFGLVTSVIFLLISLFSKNTNSLNYVLSIPVYGYILLSPFYT